MVPSQFHEAFCEAKNSPSVRAALTTFFCVNRPGQVTNRNASLLKLQKSHGVSENFDRFGFA
jgi:hypothetical protein